MAFRLTREFAIFAGIKPNDMNVLILGSGGREHALAWMISRSKKLDTLFIAPGNAGTASAGVNLDVKADDFESVKKVVLQENVKIVVVGPEAPLVAGISDFFREDPELEKVTVIGPSRAGAQLEGSKDFAKMFMRKYNIPTARFRTFIDYSIAEGQQFLEELKPPYVLKADGLAGGKGVLIMNDLEEAVNELENMLHGKFGEASKKVVIEEFLDGIEMSVFVLTDGEDYVMLPGAKDYKRIGEGDTGLNTGGMGAISPVPFADDDFMKKVEDRVVRPTIRGLKSERIPYIGFIFFGLMNVDGDPYVVEYNVRMGDPEAEVVLPRIQSDLLGLLEAAGEGRLGEQEVGLDPDTVATVMLASGGYPGKYEKGKEITGLEKVSGSMLFHAGTTFDGDRIVTNGGRVIAVSSYGSTMKEALERSYESADNIAFDGKYLRRDIGFDL